MYNGEYKCRHCGKIFKSISAPNINTVINNMAYIIINDPVFGYEHLGPQRAELYSSHSCDDGSLGLADFIGFEKDSQEVRK